ncbi:hypothetical protein D3C77_617160 [compost metagenome]
MVTVVRLITAIAIQARYKGTLGRLATGAEQHALLAETGGTPVPRLASALAVPA